MVTQHIVLDLEMNPVAKHNREIRYQLSREVIEIGAVKISDSGIIIDKYRCFVRPQFNEGIVPFITHLTGISDRDVKNAVFFIDAIKMLEKWIGTSCETKIYSWSKSDFDQITKESELKDVTIPENMKIWVDFQAIYPDVMGFDSSYRQMSLHKAAEQYGVVMDNKNRHSALYDAEITAELVIPVLTGAYKLQAELIRQTMKKEKQKTFTLGDAYGEVFKQLKTQLPNERGRALA